MAQIKPPAGRIVKKAGAKREAPGRKKRPAIDSRRQIRIQKALYEIADAASALSDMQVFYKRLHEIVGELMYARNFYVTLYDPATQVITSPYFADEAGDLPPPPSKLEDYSKSLRAHVLRTGETLHLSGMEIEQGKQSGKYTPQGTMAVDWVGVPLKMSGQVIGMLTIQSYRKGIRYGDPDVQLLEFVAQHIAVALTRARAIDETRQRNAELQIINSVQEGLASKLDLQAIYDLIGEKVREVFNVQVIDIVAYDPEANLIFMPYSYEKGDRSVFSPREPYGIRLHVIKARQPLLINENFVDLAAQYNNPLLTGVWPKSALFVPLVVEGRVKGIISIQDLDRENAFTVTDMRLLQTLANSMSVAIENARLFDETQRLLRETEARNAELAIINSVQQGLASKLELQAIYDLVGDKLHEIFRSQVVAIGSLDRPANLMHLHYLIEKSRRIYSPPMPPLPGLQQYLDETKQPMVINENMEEASSRLGMRTIPGTEPAKSWLIVPLIVDAEVKGAISLQDIDREHAFSESEVRLLTTVAGSMSVALENARLWDQEKKYREALERELEIGREIQAGFLPQALPLVEGWEITASLRSAREVAGDFYDAFELPDGTVGLVIADVCDKGVGAALFMTLFRSLIRAASNLEYFEHSTPADSKRAPADRLQRTISLTNNYIAETHGESGMFATIFIGILDPLDGRLFYVNGGHEPPFILQSGEVREVLHKTGPAVGAIRDYRFDVRETKLISGDVFFAYTDGVLEASDPHGDFFGRDRLLAILRQDPASAPALIKSVELELHQFISAGIQFDDITLLAARRS